jgi:hypothetical protein
VFTDSQISQIRYNYYINNVSIDRSDSLAKLNSGRLQNIVGIATGAAYSLELDEDITPLDTNDTPPLDIQGAITRARAR